MPEKEAAINNWSSVQHAGVQVWAHTNTQAGACLNTHTVRKQHHILILEREKTIGWKENDYHLLDGALIVL